MEPDPLAPSLLDPIAVLRALRGSGAYVVVTVGPGSTVSGSIVEGNDDVSVLLDHDATATFVRHDAVAAVTVRDAHAFGAELGIPRFGAPTRPVDVVSTPELSLGEVQALLGSVGFEHDAGALAAATPAGRVGIAALVEVVDDALRSIAGDPAADEAMRADVDAVRLVDGPVPAVALDGTTLVVASPWTQGPGGVYDPGSLRAAILDATR